MNLLKRELAPLTTEAWDQIDEQARKVLQSLLTARRFADVSGPHGPELSTVSTGRLALPGGKKRDSHFYGIRQAVHLVEVRIPFELNIWEMDNAARGAQDIELSALDQAAAKLAAFEEGILYSGSDDAGIEALRQAVSHDPIPYKQEAESFISALAKGITQLKAAAVDGPYALVVDPSMWELLSSYVHGRPLEDHLRYLLGGPLLLSEYTLAPFLISLRGGDLELILGQDIAVGYQKHDDENVELFFTETFTYRLLEPSAIVFFGE